MRLMISGFPCSSEPWKKLYEGLGPTEVVTFGNLLDHCSHSDIRIHVFITFNMGTFHIQYRHATYLGI